MNIKLFFLLSFFLAALGLDAQSLTIAGSVADAQNGRPIEMATVRLLLLPDSTLADGTSTDSLGRFFLTGKQGGRHLLKINYVGFEPVEKVLRLSADTDTTRVGEIRLSGNDIALGTAVVTATVARVEQREDTTVFNAAAFRTPEGSTLEALVKQLPGAEVSEDGTIKVNGKTVKEFLVNGKDFFKGDTKVAMKNLPTRLVSKVKTYDKKSDYAEQTGIDDGEESFVIDIATKRELNQSFVSNIDLGGGRDYRQTGVYSGKAFGSHFTDNSRISFLASHNNVGDNSFGAPRGMRFGGSGNGITASTMIGTDFSWDNGRKKNTRNFFEVGGHFLFHRSDNDTETISTSETFLTSSARKRSFANSHRWSGTLNRSIDTRLRLKWNPDTLTSLSFRPGFNWKRSNTSTLSRTATFDQNPFERYGLDETDEILDRAFRHAPINGHIETEDDFLVNLNRRHRLGQSSSHNINGRLEITRRHGSKGGRNISLQAQGGYSENESFAYSEADIHTRNTTLPPSAPGLSVLKTNSTHQFTLNDATTWNYRVGGSYVEPIAGKLLAEFRYNYEHRFNDSNLSLYNLHSLRGYNTLADFLADHPQYAGIGHLYRPGAGSLISWMDPAQLLSLLNADDLQAALRDDQNSQYATYHYHTHNAQIRLRFNNQKLNLNVGLNFQPERTRLQYERPLVGAIDTVRTVSNLSPQVRLRYNFSKTRRFVLNYRGSSSEPSMTNLLNIVDSSDPLNISVGNPGLKPSWNDALRANYNDYDPETQRGIMAHLTFNQTRNAITTLLVYDTATGRRFTRPENISGQHNASAGLTFNTPLDREKIFNLSTSSNASHHRSVAYVSTAATPIASGQTPDLTEINRLFANIAAERNISRATTLSERIDLSYRQPLWDVSLNGAVNYQHARSSLQPLNNLDTWSFSYGAAANINLDNGLSLSTDLRMNSRRGFASSAMNTDELLWNAQLSKSFLADRSLTMSLRFYDLLRQQSNISRNIDATMRTDAWHNGIHAYVMLHLIHKINIFGGSKGAKHPDNRKDNDDRRPPRFERHPGTSSGGAFRPSQYSGIRSDF